MQNSNRLAFALSLFLVFLLLISCDLNTPSDPEWTNPNDGRNLDAIPEVLSINTSTGNGFTNKTNTEIYIESRAATQIRIGVVDSHGADLEAVWQNTDTLFNVQILAGDGEKWIGCQAKALNGNVSKIIYTSIKLDTRAFISSFTWSSAGGDTLVPDDRVTFIMETANDAFSAETGGSATVTVEGWEDIALASQADGSYTGSYTITNETPEVSNAVVRVSFTDRAGNVVSEESDQRLTTWWTIQPGTERTFPLGNSGESIVMCWVPAGEFMMGRVDGEQDSDNEEAPRHRVTFAEGFWMGKYEITQGQWEAVAGDNPARNNGVGDNYPVYNVRWNDIKEFEAALDNDFRLPSGSEWEYAYRAGTTTRFYWGTDINYSEIVNCAVYSGNDPGGTANVGTKSPNVWGLYDMSGNVYEWCEDRWHNDYEDAPDNGSPWLDNPEGSSRVYRGGSWSSLARRCRSAYRYRCDPSLQDNNLGFRLARDAD